MGLNTTGKPNTQDIVLGRGKIYLGSIDAVTGLGYAYRDVGNAPAFALNIESEELEHRSSMEGTAAIDKVVTLSRNLQFTMALDELSQQNLAAHMSGTLESVVNPAVAGVGSMGTPIQITDSVQHGVWYDLRDASGQRVRFTTGAGLVIRRTSGTPEDAVIDVDYEVDLEAGRIFIKVGSLELEVGDTVGWYNAAEAGAPATIKSVVALAGSNQKFALKFIQENASESDRKTEYEFHQVSLRPDGESSLIGDEFTQLAFSGAAEQQSILGKSLTITDLH